jgi:hypothetical protein
MHGISVNPTQEAALMTGMAVLQKNRYQNVPELYAALYGQPSGALVAQISAPSVVTTGTGEPPPYVQEGAQESRPPVFNAPASMQGSSPAPAPAAGKKKKMTKEKWIIAIACGVIAGILAFAWNSWQSSNNRTETPDRPSNSPPATELPTATDGITGTWLGSLVFEDYPRVIELMLDNSGKFYLLEYVSDDDWLHAHEGTYTVSGSHLQMTFQWVASFGSWLDDGYIFYDMVEVSSETHINIVGNTLHLDSLGYGMAYDDVTFTRGVPSGLWSFEHRERLINASTPEEQSPRDTTHIATVTLGDFQEFGGIPDMQGGWWSDGVDNRSSPYTVRDFTESRYLIIEFTREPIGEVDFVWIGDTNNWNWDEGTTTFMPQSRILIIDLTQIEGYNQYRQASELKIFIILHFVNWDYVGELDVYFANAR